MNRLEPRSRGLTTLQTCAFVSVAGNLHTVSEFDQYFGARNVKLSYLKECTHSFFDGPHPQVG
jgi:hypothetical protein